MGQRFYRDDVVRAGQVSLVILQKGLIFCTRVGFGPEACGALFHPCPGFVRHFRISACASKGGSVIDDHTYIFLRVPSLFARAIRGCRPCELWHEGKGN